MNLMFPIAAIPNVRLFSSLFIRYIAEFEIDYPFIV